LSAAAQSYPPPTIRNVCKTPISYFLRLVEFCNYTELKVFGCILVNTVGQSFPTTWCEIHDDTFDEAVGVTKEWWLEALSNLTGRGGQMPALIRTRKSPTTSRTEYALSEKLELEIKALTVRGKCGNCHTIGTFGTEFIPVPHAVFRRLGACIDHASFVCLMVIIRYSLKWNRERGVWAEPVQLELNDFERLTGLEPRMISLALSKLCDEDGWALVTRTERKGRASLYEARPDRFGKIDRREARVVTMPANREKSQSTTDSGLHQNPQNSDKTHAFESDDRVYGFCRSCGQYGPIEQVDEVEVPPKPPEHPPRSGPPPKFGRKPRKKERVDAMLERFREKYAHH
jgi:hypothetical protein